MQNVAPDSRRTETRTVWNQAQKEQGEQNDNGNDDGGDDARTCER